ncbi:MAG: DUF4442 domain-containing protein [Polyangiaceae bacterium]|nr:DUF4442 domain-containing protein [Polyangiaceae bacterium]
MLDADVAKQMLGSLPLVAHLGVEIADVTAEGGAAQLPDRDHLKNHLGTQHAGALFTVGEAASGAAVLGAFGEAMGALTPVAKTARIDYRKPARGLITATASLTESAEDVMTRLQQNGKAVFEVRVALHDAAGLLVAEMQVDWHLRKN